MIPGSTSAALAFATLLAAEPSATVAGPPLPLPRSSIAAVLAHRGELGLDEAQVAQLEARDVELQRQLDDLRLQLQAAHRARAGGSARAPGGGAAGTSPPASPSGAARPEGGASGPRGGGHRAGAGGRAAPDPARRASDLQAQIDDADTAAWLAAESALRASQRDRARAIAEAYREARSDQREAERVGR